MHCHSGTWCPNGQRKKKRNKAAVPDTAPRPAVDRRFKVGRGPRGEKQIKQTKRGLRVSISSLYLSRAWQDTTHPGEMSWRYWNRTQGARQIGWKTGTYTYPSCSSAWQTNTPIRARQKTDRHAAVQRALHAYSYFVLYILSPFAASWR